MAALADALRSEGKLLAMMAAGEVPLQRAEVARIAAELQAAAKAIDTAAAHQAETTWQKGRGHVGRDA